MMIFMMIPQQNAPFPQVINNQLPSKENTSKKLMSISTELKWIIVISISTVYCLLGFTYVLLHVPWILY